MDGRRPRPKSLALPSSSSFNLGLGPSLSGSHNYGGGSILKGGGMLKSGDHSNASTADLLTKSGIVQNRFEEEASAYKRRLDSYRQAQHQQALLVARLQSKLLQYRQRCNALEVKLGQTPVDDPSYFFGSPTRVGNLPDFPSTTMHARPSNEMEDSIWKLEQERARNDSLVHLNRELRGELDETRKVNNALSTDLQNLSDDWEKLTKQMEERDGRWKAEEQAYNEYYASEHNKLLSLWRKVAATKREYSELKSATSRDMAQLKNNLARVSNIISQTFISAAIMTPPQQEAEKTAFLATLSQELTNSQNAQENLRKQIKDRDDRIHSLESSIEGLESKSQGLENELNRISTQELGLLQNSLREIGKLLLSDFDQHGILGDSSDGHELHLTSSPAIYIYDENGENPTVFAESIVSAVQAALNKRQLQIHQLQVNLSSQKEQSMVLRGHVDSMETDLSKMDEKNTAYSDANEKFKELVENLKLERDTAQRSLDNLKNEKNILEEQRKNLSVELDSNLKVKSNMTANIAKMEKIVETCREEIEQLNSDLEKTREELITKTGQLKLEQELSTKIRDQLATIGEDKEKYLIESKSLKNTLNELNSKYEDVHYNYERTEDALKKWKMDGEILAEKLKSSNERGENAEKEKKKWTERAKTIEQVKETLELELQDARNDLTTLRREILEAERNKTELENKIENLQARMDAAENKKAILENQLDNQREEFIREVGHLSEKNEITNEELNVVKRELEETLMALERVKSDLSNAEKNHMLAVHIVEAKENDIKNLSNTIDKLREEKLSLEELEDTLKTALMDRDRKIETLEKQIKDLKLKMNSEIGTLREKLTRSENDARAQREKFESDKLNLESKFSKEIEAIRSSSGANEEKIKTECEEKLKNLKSELDTEKKNEASKLSSEINGLRSQIESLRVQYEEALYRAENDKQQGLLLAQQDQQGLSDKIRLLERELEESRNDKDRLKRECEAKCNHEKNALAALRTELIKIKNELETTKQDRMETIKVIQARLQDIERERENALATVEELRNKISAAEERELELKREFNDVSRKLRDSENTGEISKKEIAEMTRTLNEMAIEKEKNGSIIENLKEDVKQKESDLLLQKRELNKVQIRVKELERTKLEMDAEIGNLSQRLEATTRDKIDTSRHLEEINEQLSQTKSNAAKLDSELTEHKVKLEAETERRDEAEVQWRNAKKMLDETEAGLQISKNEEEKLALKLAETEERYARRESQYIGLAEENKLREKKLQEEKYNLNVALGSIQQNINDLTGKLYTAENKLKMLTDEKMQQERLKNEAEAKLNQIQSGFKRLGISSTTLDNPDAVRRVMATLQTQMTSLQQDRDTLAGQLSGSRETMTNLESAKSSLEDQLSLLARNIQSTRGDNKAKENQIFTLEREISLKNGEISRLAEKVRELEDQLKNKEDQIKNVKNDKESFKDEMDKTRQKLEDSRQHWESKWAKAEVNMRALEGDLNRMALVLQQKESHITTMEDKCSMISKNNNDLEERVSGLTMAVEQLNISLEKAEQNTTEWRDKCNNMGRNFMENSGVINQMQEKVRSLQREKTQLEQERNNFSDKWESSSNALQDYKRQVQSLLEKNQKLRMQSEEMTRSSIDKQLKIAIAETGKEDFRQLLGEKLELQRKIDNFSEKIRDLEKENRELERFKENVPLKGSYKTHIKDNTLTLLEDENSELRRKINKLEAEIRDLERRHAKNIGEVTSQVKQERDFELERARAAKLQAEKLLEARESNYRQQIQRLEQQVQHLKGQEIKSLRQALGDSLRNVSIDPNTIDAETKRLDTTLDIHKSASQNSLHSPMRDPSPAGFKKQY